MGLLFWSKALTEYASYTAIQLGEWHQALWFQWSV